MLKQFWEFVREYGVLGLAIAVIIGGKMNALVIPGGDWRTTTLDIGPVHLLLGPGLWLTH